MLFLCIKISIRYLLIFLIQCDNELNWINSTVCFHWKQQIKFVKKKDWLRALANHSLGLSKCFFTRFFSETPSFQGGLQNTQQRARGVSWWFKKTKFPPLRAPFFHCSPLCVADLRYFVWGETRIEGRRKRLSE